MQQRKATFSASRFGEGAEWANGCRDPAMMTSDYKSEPVHWLPPARNELETELAEHIFAQLKSSYDKLLDEPLPPHLQRLLMELDSRESDS